MRHPEREALDPFLRGLDTGAAGLVLHLLRCEACAAHAFGSLAPPEQARGLLSLRRAAAPVDYSSLWERIDETSRKAAARLREERSEAEPLLRGLLRRPHDERLQLIRRSSRHRSWALADLLLDEARTRPPERREELARLVLAMGAEGLQPHAERVVADLLAAAECEVAESLRLRGELAGAEAAFGRSAPHLHGSADTLGRATFCHLLAALRCDQGRTDEALGLLVRAADLLEDSGNRNARSAVLAELGFLALDRGEPERALAAFDDAGAQGRNLSADLACRVATGTALALAFEGRFDEALFTLEAIRDHYGWTPNSREGLRLLALEGRIALSLEQGDRARKALTTAFHGFVQLGEPFEAVLAAVHLARVLLQAGAPRKEVRQLAHQMQPFLAAPKVPEPARGALSSFVREAAASGPLNVSRLRELAEMLERPGAIPAEGPA
jgi:tetratricopeptide (TPR) repeat protein